MRAADAAFLAIARGGRRCGGLHAGEPSTPVWAWAAVRRASSSSAADGIRERSVFVVNSEGYPNTSPVLLGLTDALLTSTSSVGGGRIGFYQPVAGAPFPGAPPGSPPRHAALLAAAFPGLPTAVGPARAAVVRALAEGKDEEVIQAAADGFETFIASGGGLGACVIEGAHEEAAWAAAAVAARAAAAATKPSSSSPPLNLPSIRLSLNARLAAALGVRVLVVVDASSPGYAGHGHHLAPRPGALAGPEDAAFELATRAAVCVRALRRAGAGVAGVLVNQGADGGGNGGRDGVAALAAALAPRLLSSAGARLVGILPTDPSLAAAGLVDVAATLGARPLEGGGVGPGRGHRRRPVVDAPVSSLVVAGGTPAGALAALKKAAAGGTSARSKKAPPARPLVLADADRGDVVAALLAPPPAAAAGRSRAAAASASALVLCGVPRSSGSRPAPAGVAAALAAAAAAASSASTPRHLPAILTTPLSLGEAFLAGATGAPPSLRPTSAAKIRAAVALWRASIPRWALEEAGEEQAGAGGLPTRRPPPPDPPARFVARIFAAAASPPSAANGGGAPRARIVLPESSDARILAASVEVARRGIAEPVLLGEPETIRAAAAAAGLPPGLDGVSILDPAADPAALQSAAARLAAARAHAGLTLEGAASLIASDPTWYGTLMVAAGSADGLVSGAIHTTADTIRPALQLLRGPRAAAVPATAAQAPAASIELPTPNLVSSLFFMCLPSGVVAFSDCALCVEPSPADLAAIALASAATAQAFGLGGSSSASSGEGVLSSSLLPPIRVALLSYSTASSGAGAAVDRVRAAAAIAAAATPPGVAVEGPLQYDAATCPSVAATKLSPAALAASRVAGVANVLVFPSLEAGNIAYKATQAAAGAVVVGPLLQGLSLGAANDLSRGCAVPDIVCTVAATVLQARALKARRGDGGGGGVAAAAA